MKVAIQNDGNTVFKNLRLYDILPSLQDGRGGTGHLLFTGMENLDATIYYTTKPVAELPD